MIKRGSTALESANALFRGAQAPANAERLDANIWDGVTATRSTRRWLHRGRALAVAADSFALDIPHVASLAGIAGEMLLKVRVSFPGKRARAHAQPPARAQPSARAQAWRGGGRRAAGGAAARGRRLAVFAYRRFGV